MQCMRVSVNFMGVKYNDRAQMIADICTAWVATPVQNWIYAVLICELCTSPTRDGGTPNEVHLALSFALTRLQCRLQIPEPHLPFTALDCIFYTAL